MKRPREGWECAYRGDHYVVRHVDMPPEVTLTVAKALVRARLHDLGYPHLDVPLVWPLTIDAKDAAIEVAWRRLADLYQRAQLRAEIDAVFRATAFGQ